MATNSLYYRFKPYLPWRARIFFRRLLAGGTRQAHSHVWPISESAGQRPAGWPGWPGGKQFALVLTHDVEGMGGLTKCRPLLSLEKKLGFRGSFNFIPEGDYRVSRELREEIEREGFEVGVHDLHHDGKLYRNRAEFMEKAGSINRYLRDWKVGGFRSGFMHHELDWAQGLDIKYDASTFDTDPFEPQPDSVNTIFPFWVPGQNGRGYVELPYTLPQDFTLFIVLKEKGPVTWKRKLDWIVEKGGMALVNVHPDYMNFARSETRGSEYPASWYKDFLDYVNERYGGKFWNPLPHELADWYNETCRDQKKITPSSNDTTAVAAPVLNGSAKPVVADRSPIRHSRPQRVCMITHSIYETDNRVTRYAGALAERGDEVDVLALKRDQKLPTTETIGKVRLHRLQMKTRKDQHNRSAYLFPVLRFWLRSSLWLTWNHLRRPYDTIHVHNVPDFLVFAAWLPRLTGAKVILDIHDMVPEFYASKFHVADESKLVRTLKIMERVSARFSHHVIISNHLWHSTYTSRSAPEGKCSIFINWVDGKLFDAGGRPRAAGGKFIAMFPGGLQWHQGLDIAINAFAKLKERLPQAEFHIYGDGNMKEELIELTKKLDLTETVKFFEPLPGWEIAQKMASADLGVVPKRADSFGNEAYSTKIMEFMSLGVPCVVSSTKIDRFYFNDSLVRFFESGNSDALADAIFELANDQSQRESLVSNGLEYASKNNWQVRKSDYLQLVDSLS